MKKYYFILIKESLQVIRDLPGLALLFLMPALLLIVITLTQEKVMIGMESGIKTILVSADSSALGEKIEEELKANTNFICDVFKSEKEAEKAVYSGRYQVMVIVPQGSDENLRKLAMQHALETGTHTASETAKLTGIRVLYDPAVMKVYKDIIGFSLQVIIESTALQLYIKTYKETVEESISHQLQDYRKKLRAVEFEKNIPDFPGRQEVIHSIRSGIEQQSRDSIHINLPANYLAFENLVSIEEGIAGDQEQLFEYNIVRNNIPAFILFAMFFIVIPLAGSILGEKQQGTNDRLLTLPLSRFTIFSGKITVYLLVCILQFLLMVSIGRYILPLISNYPPLPLDVNLGALLAIIIASALAAIGFGLLIGTYSSTFLQAAPIGSVLVVILAILGGIFVPDYMMPDLISKISFISPLRWGTDAFFSIFARKAGMDMVLPQFLYLIVFFVISLILSVKAIRKHN